ncbi:HAD hydrolase-like protein [Acinetobacter sp. SwsAc4]|uniref:HAD hydrolase-like protein n=1 Tax=Acinetobacter sp. SwsAc4 TaxID=2749437 RepID=UPI0015BE6238|nr:HAD hydrolase-like protein [Acinetobacter sp. SwsAc4]NWK80879.1 HAD hydrolase-like protein [Acinetobacter sp. SwsAc4]
MRIGFDLDGTLITCREKQVYLMDILAKVYDINLDKDFFWELKRGGANNIDSLRKMKICENIVLNLNDKWIMDIENLEWLFFDKKIDGVSLFLENLIKKGHSLHLISARNNKFNSLMQLEILNLTKFFKTIDFVSQRKNENKSFFLKKRGVHLYIGDTEYDSLSCKESNIQSILVCSGMRNKSYLANLGVLVVDNVLDLDGILYEGN